MSWAPISAELYEHLALVDREARWELRYGRLRTRPWGTFQHNHVVSVLGFMIAEQLDRTHFTARMNAGRLRRTSEHYYVPDFMVIPRDLEQPLRAAPDSFEVYDDPLPLVVEVWSKPVPEYDFDDLQEIEEYRRRGDQEIWLVHPNDRTVTAWQRQPDGGYAESTQGTGVRRPVALSGVEADLDAVWQNLDHWLGKR